MQVGLATEQLNDNQPFKNLSYGGALLAISAALLGVAIMLLVWFVLFWYHFLSTMAFDRWKYSNEKEERAGCLNPYSFENMIKICSWWQCSATTVDGCYFDESGSDDTSSCDR
jgi:hypothetical protein